MSKETTENEELAKLPTAKGAIPGISIKGEKLLELLSIPKTVITTIRNSIGITVQATVVIETETGPKRLTLEKLERSPVQTFIEGTTTVIPIDPEATYRMDKEVFDKLTQGQNETEKRDFVGDFIEKTSRESRTAVANTEGRGKKEKRETEQIDRSVVDVVTEIMKQSGSTRAEPKSLRNMAAAFFLPRDKETNRSSREWAEKAARNPGTSETIKTIADNYGSWKYIQTNNATLREVLAIINHRSVQLNQRQPKISFAFGSDQDPLRDGFWIGFPEN